MAARKNRKQSEQIKKASGPVQYQVIRRRRLSPTVMIEPGDLLTPGVDWPHRRVKQFVDQGYLVPVSATAATVEPAPDPDPPQDDGEDETDQEGSSDSSESGDPDNPAE